MILKKGLFIFALFISAVSFGQNNQIVPGDLSPIFDISPDGRKMVLSISTGETSTLYILSLSENILSQLTGSDSYYTRPVYSPKEKAFMEHHHYPGIISR